MFLYLAVVLYAPALALNEVTGFSLFGSILAVGAVVTFYTSMGGLRAVLWTDTFQTFVVVASLLGVVVIGSNKVGGMGRVWEISSTRGRTEFFNFNLSPFERTTFFGVTLGSFVGQMTIYGASQTMLQRYMSIQIMLTALGAGGGPLLGLFILGMFFPCVNSFGATSALIVSTIVTFWIAIGAIVKQVPQPTLPFSVKGCQASKNMSQIFNNILSLHDITSVTSAPSANSDHFEVNGFNVIYKLSFLWYPTLAVFVALVVGILASAVTNWTERNSIESRLLYPVHKKLCCFLPYAIRKRLNCSVLWTDSMRYRNNDGFFEDSECEDETLIVKSSETAHLLDGDEDNQDDNDDDRNSSNTDELSVDFETKI